MVPGDTLLSEMTIDQFVTWLIVVGCALWIGYAVFKSTVEFTDDFVKFAVKGVKKFYGRTKYNS